MTTKLEAFEMALADLVAERTTGDEPRWPTIAWVAIAMTTDPEAAEFDDPVVLTAQGQKTFVTRGILEETLDAMRAETAAAISLVSWDGEDDDDD